MKEMDKDSHQTMKMEMDKDKDKDMKMDTNAHTGMSKEAKGPSAKQGEKHQVAATIKALDPTKRTVTLEHEPVKSLKWPAMTMGFSVKDKMLFEKMTVGKKVTVDLMKDGSQYVVTDVK
jgi:Cu(I)/Ag(I) efflux system protein CusF